MLTQVNWKNIRETVSKNSPEFAKIIDSLDPDPKKGLYFYSVTYPYGSVIVDQGTFQIPNKDNYIVPLNHSTIPQTQKEDLGYSGTVPLGFVTENCIEVFMCGNERIIPSYLARAGQFISLWRVLDEGLSFHAGRFWNLTSGARAVCMIPKITDSKSHKNIKTAFCIKNNVPQKLFDHWDLFVKIANHRNFSSHWNSTVLFFPKQWFAHTKDLEWSHFYRYLFNTVWKNSSFRRNQFIFDFVFSLAQENVGLRPNPYLADTVRHLIAIGSGAVPGFTPAIDDSAAPVSGLQRVYLECYELKKYAPVIVHSHHFSKNDQRNVYYSFQMPTTTVFSPRSRKLFSTMRDIQEAQQITALLFAEILRGNLGMENNPLYWLAENVKYSFYHSDKDKFGVIMPASEIAKIDTNFSKTLRAAGNYTFPDFAPFFKGCVAIS